MEGTWEEDIKSAIGTSLNCDWWGVGGRASQASLGSWIRCGRGARVGSLTELCDFTQT